MNRLKFIDKLGSTNINYWVSFFENTDYWSRDKIVDYQNEKLKRLVKHCYQNVPYYNNLFDNLKLKPTDFSSIYDLSKLPVLRKEDIKKDPKSFISTNFNKFKPVHKRTGGSTGVPFEYYNDRELRSIQWALKYKSWGRGGYRFGDKIGVLGGGSLYPKEQKSYKHIIRNKLNNFYKFPMTFFSEEKVDEYIQVIKKENIKYLRGYPSAISKFAELSKKHNLEIHSVFTTAEVLTPEFRSIIQDCLNAEVFDQYGCADAGAHASECELHNGLHMYDQIFITELVKNNEPVSYGKEGELIFTSLFNYSMPFLRYAPEDLAIEVNEKCSCGRNTKLFSQISGRSTDVIKLKNGNYISGPALTLLFSRVNVHKYQVVQKDYDRIEIFIIPEEEFTDKNKKTIEQAFISYFNNEKISLYINIVESIKLPVSGKFRFVISEIK